MITSLKYIFPIAILLSLFTGSFSQWGSPSSNATLKYKEAETMAFDALVNFFQLYQMCVGSTMRSKNFIIDNVQAFLFYPAKTTVGYAPKFSSNRKFFANLIGTTAFHHMLKKDLNQLRASFIDKLKFCDHTVMDEAMLKDMYDREYTDTSYLK